jgi:hypothetical protein
MENIAPNVEQPATETEAYSQKFYEPAITAYDFLKLFFAVLYHDGIRGYPRDFSNIIYSAKQNTKYSELLEDIHFKSNGVFRYSNQIEDSIFKLKMYDLIATISPQDKIIVLQYDSDTVSEIFGQFTEENIANTREIASQIVELRQPIKTP